VASAEITWLSANNIDKCDRTGYPEHDGSKRTNSSMLSCIGNEIIARRQPPEQAS
jgi:hypothetical protein